MPFRVTPRTLFLSLQAEEKAFGALPDEAKEGMGHCETQGATKRRPWAVGCNPFGVKRATDTAIDTSFLPARTI